MERNSLGVMTGKLDPNNYSNILEQVEQMDPTDGSKGKTKEDLLKEKELKERGVSYGANSMGFEQKPLVYFAPTLPNTDSGEQRAFQPPPIQSFQVIFIHNILITYFIFLFLT